MTRQSQHNRSWSPLNDAWSGLARLRLMLISLRDDHRTKPSRERARHPQRRSERAACSMQARYPIWDIDWKPERLSASFHGRDLFAPVAATLARGEPPPGQPRQDDADRRVDWPDDLCEV